MPPCSRPSCSWRRSPPRPPPRRPARCGSTTSTPRAPPRSASPSTASCSRAPGPGNPDRPIDDTNLGKYLFEVIDRATNRVALLARLREHLRRVGDDRRGEARRTAPSTSRCASPRRRARCRSSSRSATADGLFREVWSTCGRPGGPDRRPRPARPRASVWAVLENGPPRDKVDLLLLGDGYTAAEMEKWHADAKRLAEILFAASPFKERKADFNVWAIDTPVGGERGRAPLGRRPPPLAPARRLRRLRLRALRPRLRQPAPARGGGRGALRVHRDRGQRPQVRRRRHPQPLRDRRRRQRLHALRLRPRVRPPLRRASPTSTTPPTSPTAAAPSGPSPGSRTSPPIPRAPKWRDLVAAGTPLPTPWAKEEFEAAQKEIQARRRKIRAEKRPEEEMEALFREEQQKVDALLGAGPHAAAVGRLRGRAVRGQGLLPAAGGLHHVHPRHGVLRGLPARDRAGHRPVRPAGSVARNGSRNR